MLVAAGFGSKQGAFQREGLGKVLQTSPFYILLELNMFIYFCADSCIYVRSNTLEVIIFNFFVKASRCHALRWNTTVILCVMYFSRFLCKILFWILYFMLQKAIRNVCLVIKKSEHFARRGIFFPLQESEHLSLCYRYFSISKKGDMCI